MFVFEHQDTVGVDADLNQAPVGQAAAQDLGEMAAEILVGGGARGRAVHEISGIINLAASEQVIELVLAPDWGTENDGVVAAADGDGVEIGSELGLTVNQLHVHSSKLVCVGKLGVKVRLDWLADGVSIAFYVGDVNVGLGAGGAEVGAGESRSWALFLVFPAPPPDTTSPGRGARSPWKSGERHNG